MAGNVLITGWSNGSSKLSISTQSVHGHHRLHKIQIIWSDFLVLWAIVSSIWKMEDGVSIIVS